MSLKLSALSKVTALFASLAMLNGLPTTAEAAPADDVSPEVIATMQRDLKLSKEQVVRRLNFEAAAPAIEGALKAELGNRFGGAWLNNEGSQLIVGVTNQADAELVRSAGAEPRLVSRTLEQLEQIKAKLDKDPRFTRSDIHSWFVDPMTNSVVVRAAQSSPFGNFTALLGKDAEAIRVEPSAEAPRPLALYPLIAGQAFLVNGSARCTIGFPVTAGGFITAGHCGRAGATTTSFSGVAQGVFQASTFPGGDYAWVKTNSNWYPTNQIACSSTLRTTGSSVAPVGSSVCRCGSTSTSFRCGTIRALNVTVNFAQGVVYQLTQTSACADPGDSGSPYFSGNLAQGVLSGGSGSCSTGGTSFFQPIRPILSAYGLTLQTN